MITARPVVETSRRLVATVDVDGAVHELWWEVADLPDGSGLVPPAGDVLVAATLLAASLGGHELRIEAPVSTPMRSAAGAVTDVFAIWARRRQLETDGEPGYGGVRLTTAGVPAPSGASGGVAAMFSAGVDSFFTVLRHRDRLDALIYVVGFDVRLGSPALGDALALVRSAAAMLELPLIEVRTNLRDVLDDYVPWDDQHGAALASVALLLSDRFVEVLVPATHTYDELYPLGSHPVVDRLWTNGAVALVNDGGGFDRATKVGAISSLASARSTLRVCFQFADGVVNCGRCEKCVRTMVGARIAGVADGFDTLPAVRGPRRLARVAATVPLHRATTWRWYQLLLRREVHDPALRAAVEVAMARWRVRRWRTPRWGVRRWRVRRLRVVWSRMRQWWGRAPT